jgi:hypothetical protein
MIVRSCPCSVLMRPLAMGEAVGYSVRGIAAGVHWNSAFKLVVSGFVQQITDRNHRGHPASEENQLAGGSAIAQRLRHRIQFPSSVAQVMVRYPKVHHFQGGVTGKKHFVGFIPKAVWR